MSKVVWASAPSVRFLGQVYYSPTDAIGGAIYGRQDEWVIRQWRSGKSGDYKIIAGPFESLEDAKAAYELMGVRYANDD